MSTDVSADVQRRVVLRHPLSLRVQHALNAAAILLLLMSGLGIFNAHPALYLGQDSRPAREVLRIGAADDGLGGLSGHVSLLGHRWDTRGWVGTSADAQGEITARAFPAWSTLPAANGLSRSREWHFFAAWLLVFNGVTYLVLSIVNRHLRRDLWPDVQDWRGLGASLLDHLRFRHPRGEQALRYNILQKVAYLVVILGLVPGLVVTGLAMSPALNAVWPGWVELLGGRQSARTLHFVFAFSLAMFVLVHLIQVLVSGSPLNYVRSIVTGRFVIPPERHEDT